MADEQPVIDEGSRQPEAGSAVNQVGSCAWSVHEELYPPGLKPAERIAYYAQRFPVVEVNSSYYHILPPRTYEN